MLRRAAEPLWPAGLPDDRIYDRPLGISTGSGSHNCLAGGWAASQTALFERPFLLRGWQELGTRNQRGGQRPLEPAGRRGPVFVGS
jgi:hypothetical protein